MFAQYVPILRQRYWERHHLTGDEAVRPLLGLDYDVSSPDTHVKEQRKIHILSLLTPDVKFAEL